jgi:excisionase family DNA binding protein
MHPAQFNALRDPKYAPIPRACDLLGLGRTKIYALAGEGLIRIVKAGGRSLVDIEQALAWMATLPAAEIAPQTRKTGGE